MSCTKFAISSMKSSIGSTPRIESESGFRGWLEEPVPFEVVGRERVGDRRIFFGVETEGEEERRRRLEALPELYVPSLLSLSGMKEERERVRRCGLLSRTERDLLHRFTCLFQSPSSFFSRRLVTLPPFIIITVHNDDNERRGLPAKKQKKTQLRTAPGMFLHLNQIPIRKIYEAPIGRHPLQVALKTR
jgi:hypothetical protein